VNGLHVEVTAINLPGLPVGSEVIVAHSASLSSAF
jgi:hypothetical protein